MAVRRIVPDLTSTDVYRARDFYTGVLGLEVAMDLGWIITCSAPGNPSAQVSMMTRDEAAPLNPALSLEVDDVDAVHAEAERRDFEVLYPLTDEPWGVRRFFVRDPDGVVVNVLSHQAS